ncbi:hypothetical protein [Fulvivirga lutea]|uniref:Porin n=1 Tax=Fulvivirga lutea TaxID=2810512 RepID=A0A975A2P4_9BACT|nr:hypothetical protein [Fulvivirga lutea]QSE98757.1 hypothetical protein JR347_06665 [Fulvivirga lutea]
MKKFIILALIHFTVFGEAISQDSTYFELGEGANLSLNDGDYFFSIGGNLKSAYTYTRDTAEILESKHGFALQRAQFSLLGKAKNEKMTFFILADFVNTWSLLEAWVGFDVANKKLFISAGQKLVNTNNREVNTHQNYFQFVNRSILSSNYARLGREFGLFIDGNFDVGGVVLKPSLAFTSGDGINSFGNGTTDRYDYGGAKFGGRLEVYPFGEFSEGNDFLGADLARESTPKIMIGSAFSSNQGASDQVGEGHGQFVFYSQIDSDGQFRNAYPNYQKLYADVIVKFKGFNASLEYVNAFGSEITGLYTNTDPLAQIPIYKGDISQYLVLGTGLNVQAGYLTKNNWSLDVRYTQITPEFDNEPFSVITNQEDITVGLTKFLKGQAMKIQLNADFLTYDQLENDALVEKGEIRASAALQIIF